MSPRGGAAMLLIVSLCACSGGAAGRVQAGADADVPPPSDQRPDVEAQVPTDASSECPAAMPYEGATCPCAYSCEFGTDPDVRCNTQMTGSHGQWTVTRRPDATGCDGMRGAACPLEFSGLIPGEACVTEGLTCAYPEARCSCTVACRVGVTGTSPRWCCTDAARPGTRCPAVRPRIGSRCTVEGESCDYGGCSGNVSLSCISASWQDVPQACAW